MNSMSRDKCGAATVAGFLKVSKIICILSLLILFFSIKAFLSERKPLKRFKNGFVKFTVTHFQHHPDSCDSGDFSID